MFGLRLSFALAVAACIVSETIALAGGSGLNTVIVVNQENADSVTLGNYFCERRQLPPENLIRIHWSGDNISWSAAQFQTNFMVPLRAALATRQISNQIQTVVLSMAIPFQTVSGSTVNSTTSAIFYGAKDISGPDSKTTGNSYAFSEIAFAERPTNSPSFLVTMITAGSLDAARHLVDQGVNSDGTFPTRPVILAKSSDSLRNIRYQSFDNAIFNTQIRGNSSVLRTNSDQPSAQTNLLGYETGLAGFSVSANTFVPGAIADSLTSFGGIIFGPNGQTSLLEFIRAGAAGSYGTVSEPSPDPQKFPDPQVYFFQSRGFTLVEAYYLSLAVPYQGIIVGEPLAAPFAQPCSGQWLTTSNSTVSGTTSLALQFSSTADRPIQKVDLFVDGKFFQTITNLQPLAGNKLAIALNGISTNYTIAATDTLSSIASNITAMLHTAAATNTSRIMAQQFGDRIELRYVSSNAIPRPDRPFTPRAKTNAASIDASLPGTLFSFSSSAGSTFVARTFLTASRNFLMQSPACGLRSFNVSGPIQIGSWLQLSITKTNGTTVNIFATNQLLNATPFTLSGTLFTNVNAHPALAGSDGLTAEDLTSGWSNEGIFNLRARSSGYAAGMLQVRLSGSSNLFFTPNIQSALDQNISDLQPRGHLYVTAGSTNVSLSFAFDTTTVPDGFHELTAVAYEGSHVRTQTHITLPLRIQNSSLTATLTSSDLTNTAPVVGTYHVQVSANASDVASVTLYSTGGELTTVSNQSPASFIIDATQLGEGRHPFYAIVATASGQRFRTAPLWIRFTP